MRIKQMVISLSVLNLGILAFSALVIFLLAQGEGMAQGAVDPQAASSGINWGFVSAAMAVGIGSLGAAIAVATVGSAAMGALSEKPELAGRAIIFLGLAEGIAIYGLIIAIMILAKT